MSNEVMEEQKLMERIKHGDEAAFEELVKKYKNKVTNYLFRLTRDYERAVDLAQETFIRVFFKAKKYRPIAPVSSWIFTIASNLAKTELKRMKRRNYVPVEDVYNQYDQGIAIEDSHEEDRMVKRMKRALQNLDARYRIPVVLKDLEGFSQEEIAEILKIPLGTIKARISRGRNRLKKEMNKINSMNLHRQENYQEMENERT
jgi:RNA polymerase sigma-70 factor (ECF subfamily)